jgi:hypothetical protein
VLKIGSALRQRVADAARASDATQLVVGIGIVMIIAQLALRAWALFPSWFYLDDYNLLIDAQGQRLDLSYLFEPYNSHLMPGGRLIAWIVADSGQLNWGLAAALTLLLQALASLAALWMLTTLFGARWWTLVPLALYLSSPITIPAMMWWTAGLNQVFLQCAFFLAVGAWVIHLRTRSRRWLALTTLAVFLGLFFYVKALLIFPVLVYVALAYFASGSLRNRMITFVRCYWQAAIVGALSVTIYLGYYLSAVQEPFTRAGVTLIAQIADTMLGTAFISATSGGPWKWAALAPPNSFAAPPSFAIHLSWVSAVLVILYGVLRRHGTLRAWGLLALYLTGLLALLVNSRAPVYGPVIGLEYRYLTDAACALALCVGLAFLPLEGAIDPSRPRSQPLLRIRIPGPAVAALVVAICLSAAFTTIRYVDIWHTQNASDSYMHNLAADLRAQGDVDLADENVPDAVIPGIFAPDNGLRRVISLLSTRAAFPDATSRLGVVAIDGTIRQALIGPGVVSRPGPKTDCGWLVSDQGRTIPLTARAFDFEWWLRIGYLASANSPVVVSAGSSRIETEVDAGLNSLYVKIEGTFDSVRIDGLDPGVRLCVDTIEVGQAVPGGRL